MLTRSLILPLRVSILHYPPSILGSKFLVIRVDRLGERNQFADLFSYFCGRKFILRSEEHMSELQSRLHLVCRLLLEKKKRSVLKSLFYLDDLMRQEQLATRPCT